MMFGKLRIYDIDYFVDVNDYEVIYDGDSSKLLASSGATVIDVGYVRPGFTAKLYIKDPSQIKGLQDNIRSSLISQSPTMVIDTVYPGDRTWYGFFQSPIIRNGTIKTNGNFGLPDSLYTNAVTVTFYSSTLERM